VTLVAVLGGLLLPGAATHASCRCRPVADYAPVWSPDDAKIAYVEAYENARVITLAEGNDDVVPAPAPNLVYSPDWTKAAAVVNDDARGYLLVLVAPGGTVTTLDSAFPTPPAWSPDGRRLAYVGADEGLYVIRTDGGDRRLVAARIYPYSSPAWSPDGEQLAYVIGKDVFVMGRNLTAAIPGNHVDPVWSPRGDAVAFSTNFGRRIAVVGLDGVERFDVESELPVAPTQLALAWSPSGATLLYSHHFDPVPPAPGVYELDTATGEQRQLTAFGMDATFSRDGSTIAFGGRTTIEPNPPELADCVGVGIWTIPAIGGTPRLVTRTCKDTPPTLSIHAPPSVDFGTHADLNGSVLPGSAAIVALDVHACGRRPASTVAVVDGGAWSVTAHPTVTTEYLATVGQSSVKTLVAVKPVAVLRTVGELNYEVQIRAGRSFAGRMLHVE
jgi:WD40-like Beta Propeller Repeat